MKLKKLLALIPFVLMIISGCVPPEYYFRPLPENPALPVTVAAFLPLTGANRIYAEQMREGLLAAEARINRNRGIAGRKLKLRIIDTAGTAEGTAAALKKAEMFGAVAAVAGYSTNEVSMLIKHADRLRMPMVIPMATSDRHVEASPFIYRNSFSDLQQMEALASYIYFWRKLARGAIITDKTGDEEYSRNISRNFTQSIRDLGGEITLNTELNSNAKISDDQIIKLLATDPEFILISATGKRAAEMIIKLRESRFRGIICGPDSWDDDLICASLKGIHPGECVFTALFNPDNSTREFKEFKKDFRKRFFHAPGACETQSYDALIFLAIGLEKAEHLVNFDRNWRKITALPGAAAYYTMGKKGAIDRTIYLKNFRIDHDGGQQTVTNIVHKLQYSKIKDYKVIE